MVAKRKTPEPDEAVNAEAPVKRRIIAKSFEIESAFRSDLFNAETIQAFQKSYVESTPYPHAVVRSLIDSELLSNVRSEIATHIHFTLKETDIYRIHQSGDLANLSNLDQTSLQHLPSLVRLRDALYSFEFREWITRVTGAGKLSGTKTDMAVNVYTPGSYLLCHDDVIGSRRVSYILYLTDPIHPWESEWGGGLRLYPTEVKKNVSGKHVKIPLAEHSLNIPPSFGQLSLFTVLPGESYHDVEEVYHGQSAEEDKTRIRMAISGWFHLPQHGEDGYEDGLEQAHAQNSSLAQLQGAAHEFDKPQTTFRHYGETRMVMKSNATTAEVDPGDNLDENDDILTEQDLTFLLQYIRAQYLTPDMIEKVSISFDETAVLQLDQFMCDKFEQEVRHYLEDLEHAADGREPQSDNDQEWKIARPPHKHRYAYLQREEIHKDSSSPISRLLNDLMHSHAFKKWLALATRLRVKNLLRQHTIARRFRHGKDYALATAYPSEQPQLEFTLSLTPSTVWEQDVHYTDGTANGGGGSNIDQLQVSILNSNDFGGEEVYMAGDEDDDTSIHSHSLPHIGKKADPAVYKATDDGEEDNILFANTPIWNQFSMVLRDKGTLRFVKYISKAAGCDRWDIKGEIELAENAFDEDSSDSDSLIVKEESQDFSEDTQEADDEDFAEDER